MWRKIKCSVTGKVDYPGVVYSEDWTAPREDTMPRYVPGSYTNQFNSMNLKDEVKEYILGLEQRPGPEEEPYTWAERLAVTPIHPARLRPRQFYMPTTDFSRYEYDEKPPEEDRLYAKWLGKMMMFNVTIPVVTLGVGYMLMTPLPFTMRTLMMGPLLITGMFGEAIRLTLAASQERQDLDDFLAAKEMWYIKNTEAYMLSIPLLGEETRTATQLARMELQRQYLVAEDHPEQAMQRLSPT